MTIAKRALLIGASLSAMVMANSHALAQSALFEGDVISFGDSLTDNGNLSIITGGALPNANFQGNNRFTTLGGLTFVEQLLGGVPTTDGTQAISPQSTFFGLGGALPGTAPTGDVNVAVGGAVAGSLPASPAFTNVQGQISAFLGAGGVIDNTDTITYLGGANNFFDLFGGATPPTTLAAVQTASTGIAQAALGDIGALAAQSPGQIIVVNLPDLGTIPAFLGGPAQAGASFGTGVFNQTLAAGIDQLAAANPNTDFIQADIASVFSEITANPAAFGFANVTTPCFFDPTCAAAPPNGDVQNSFLFADPVHPTNAGQALIAELIRQLLDPTIGGAAASGIADAPVQARQQVAGQALNRARSFFFQDAPQGVASSADVETFGNGSESKRGEGFIEAIFGTSTIDARGATPEVESDLYGFRAGADIYQSETLVIGAQGSFTTGNGSQPTVEFEPNTFAIDLYGAKKFGNAFAAVTIGAASLDISNIERTTIGGLTNTGETDGAQFNIVGEVGYDLKISGFTVIPSASVGFFHTSVDGYTESGVFAPLEFGDRDINSVTGTVNLRAAKNFVRENGLRGRVFAGIGYEDFLSYDADDLSVSALASTAAASTVSIDDPDGRGFLFDVGARLDFNETLSVAADYTLGIGGGDTESHQGSFRLISRF